MAKIYICPGPLRCGKLFILLIAPLLLSLKIFAIGQANFIESDYSPGRFVLFDKTAATIVVDTNDFTGVSIAAGNLKKDISRVSGAVPQLAHNEKEAGANAIIIGTIGKSALIDQLIRARKIDVLDISNKWESFFIQIIQKPLPGIENALVICGSDQRGTIFGTYDLSEQIGVSPWCFWTDTPPKHHDKLFVRAGRFVQGPPAVKYRGLFINDEAPDLTGWAKEKFGGYNHGFYTNIFDLILRLKANYLWPSMWGSCFGEDDPLNAKFANDYGVVMGSSHLEAMMRAEQEWRHAHFTADDWNFQTHSNDLKNFWREGIKRNKDFEKTITIGMRGNGDKPMAPTVNTALLEEVVAAQREIISDVMQTNVGDVPQLWALYKEVQAYYESGMRVPDDVTLLWSDDNWGNIRRLPTAATRNRDGGAGIYYHFDYVGGPTSYKWINTINNAKTWDQMDLAYQYGAKRIWVVNIGHLQHVTFPAEFFLTMAWNPDRWGGDNISEFAKLWAQREFGKQFAPQIADIVSKYTKYNARRKPELLSPNTFSLVNYQEADLVLAEWQKITMEAETIYQQLPADERDGFFETVLYPTKACKIVNELYVAAAKNHLYAQQGRASANEYADAAKKFFQADADLSAYYNHTLGGGRWEHMMDQTHLNYPNTTAKMPETNNMPDVVEIKIPATGAMGVAVEGSTSIWPGETNKAVLPQFDVFNQQSRYVDVFNKGKSAFAFSATANVPWIVLSEASGKVEKDRRLQVSVDWSKAPRGTHSGEIHILGADKSVTIEINAYNPSAPNRDSLEGFVEVGGYVSMEAEHFTANIDAGANHWTKIPNYGRTLSGLRANGPAYAEATAGKDSPCLEYKMYLFRSGKVQVESTVGPTLNFMQDRALRYAVSFDDQVPQVVTIVPAGFDVHKGDWSESVKNDSRRVKSTLAIENPGYHTLKIWMVDPGVVLEKVVVDTGGVKPSYFGPPESFYNHLIN